MKHLYLLGHPVAHSMSPAMQNAALSEMGLNYLYRLMPVQPKDLEKRVNELRDLTVAGFNVTTPHKVAILPLLDEVDDTASAIGAVNTVVNRNGHLRGFNTDRQASARVLKGAYGDLTGCRAVILGAGGAARAVASALALHAEWIIVLARDEAKAQSLARSIQVRAGTEIRGGVLWEAEKVLSSADVLVNATPVGTSPNNLESPIEANALHPNLLVFDLVYNPEKTQLIIDADSVGAHTIGGMTMLVYQGSESFKLWTGKEAPEAVMMRAARNALGGPTA